MAIIFQEKKKQKYLIFILIGIVFVILLTLWLGFSRRPSVTPTEAPLAEVSKISQKIEINFEILKNPLFQALKDFEKIPAFEGEAGRENPFISY